MKIKILPYLRDALWEHFTLIDSHTTFAPLFVDWHLMETMFSHILNYIIIFLPTELFKSLCELIHKSISFLPFWFSTTKKNLFSLQMKQTHHTLLTINTISRQINIFNSEFQVSSISFNMFLWEDHISATVPSQNPFWLQKQSLQVYITFSCVLIF